MSDPILSIRGLRKTYGTGVDALKSIDLDIRRGEIFALLGPNGAGKTTLINIICGIVTASGGEVLVDGKNWQSDFRHARSRIGLVPQELSTEAFESVWGTVSFSRGLFGTIPQMMLISVVLPAPLGPSSAKISPRWMSRSIDLSAWTPVPYVLRRPRIERIGSLIRPAPARRASRLPSSARA